MCPTIVTLSCPHHCYEAVYDICGHGKIKLYMYINKATMQDTWIESIFEIFVLLCFRVHLVMIYKKGMNDKRYLQKWFLNLKRSYFYFPLSILLVAKTPFIMKSLIVVVRKFFFQHHLPSAFWSWRYITWHMNFTKHFRIKMNKIDTWHTIHTYVEKLAYIEQIKLENISIRCYFSMSTCEINMSTCNLFLSRCNLFLFYFIYKHKLHVDKNKHLACWKSHFGDI